MNKNGGGVNANINGLHFEQNHELSTVLSASGYKLTKRNTTKSKFPSFSVSFGGKTFGFTTKGRRMYKDIFEPLGINCYDYVSRLLCPDDAFVNTENNTVYIIEKKWQGRHGSIDEKLQTCDFKKKQYEKMFSHIGFNIKYTYVLSDWYNKPEYADVLNYITSTGSFYFFNNIPTDFLGLPKIQH